MTVLYRCPTPTNHLCACGKVARKLDAKGIDFDQVRVPYVDATWQAGNDLVALADQHFGYHAADRQT